jgi:hypothetical protein
MTAGALGIQQRPTTAPEYGRQVRSGLAPAVKQKLEHLEAIAQEAHAVVRLAGDRATAARDELRRLEERLAEMRTLHPDLRPGRWIPDRTRGPSATVWQPTPGESVTDLEAALAPARADVERLAVARDLAQARWQRCARLVEACQAYLGLPAR